MSCWTEQDGENIERVVVGDSKKSTTNASAPYVLINDDLGCSCYFGDAFQARRATSRCHWSILGS
jgi:hypothetical protein